MAFCNKRFFLSSFTGFNALNNINIFQNFIKVYSIDHLSISLFYIRFTGEIKKAKISQQRTIYDKFF